MSKKHEILKITVCEVEQNTTEYVENFLDSELINNLEQHLILEEDQEHQDEYYKAKKRTECK